MQVENITDQNFEAFLKDHPKVIVKYFADWCGSCKLIAPKFKNLAEDPQNAEIAFIEVDAEKNPIARKAAGVTNLPFFATFDHQALKKGDSASKIEFVSKLVQELKESHEN